MRSSELPGILPTLATSRIPISDSCRARAGVQSGDSPDPFRLQRFVAASDIYRSVIAELEAGEKRRHWMWFIFPQIRGLGRSSTAREFAISGRDEARAYLLHSILGPRLVECGLDVASVAARWRKSSVHLMT